MIGLYTKAILAAVVAGLMATVTGLADEGITTGEWIGIAVATLLALGGVWLIPNQPESVRKYGKAVVAALVAGLGALGTGLTDGVLTNQEIVTAVIALIVGSGLVAIAPNATESDYTPRRALIEE